MQTLAMAMRAAPEEGDPLPSPFRSVTNLGALHRRGQVSLVAGASGGGKSAYATHVAVHGKYTEVDAIPTLYFSADSDKVTLGTRVAAGILSSPLGAVESLLRSGDKQTWARLDEATRHIWWSWNAAPDLEDIEQEVQAYAYANGGWPHLIVVDNLINVDHPGDGHTQKDEVMAWLQQLANETNAHVLVLHHVTGEYSNGDVAIPKKGLLDKVDKRPRLVLTIWSPIKGLMRVCPVKNSSGPAKATGTWGADVAWWPDRSFFGD